MAEITQEDWNNLDKMVKDIGFKVNSINIPDVSNFATKADLKQEVEGCIGPHCQKIESTVNEATSQISGLQEKIDHLDDIVHGMKSTIKPKGEHQHSIEEAIECPECYPEIEKAIRPKIEASLQRKPIELSDKAKKAIIKSGAPYCTRCCMPWEDETKDCCENCGEPK